MMNQFKPVAYSVVVPVYNSAKSLTELVQRILRVFKELNESVEVILVDDNSQDESWEVLCKLKPEYQEQIKIVRFSKNFGQHNATLCGFRYSRGRLILTLDDDLQHQPEDMVALINVMKTTDADLVYGVSKHKQSNYRNWASRLWKFGTKRFDEALGQGSSFRLTKAEIVEKVSAHRQHFVFIDEMIYWYTEYVTTVEVDFQPRPKGKSGYSPIKMFLLAVNLVVFYSTVPLKIMTYGGIVLSFFTFILGLFFIAKKVLYGVPVAGFTALMVTILFSTSIMLICFGIIGQYLGKMFSTLNNKPTYSIKEKEV
jgi:glycosyltransferase involved in cell wall biosynthesis